MNCGCSLCVCSKGVFGGFPSIPVCSSEHPAYAFGRIIILGKCGFAIVFCQLCLPPEAIEALWVEARPLARPPGLVPTPPRQCPRAHGDAHRGCWTRSDKVTRHPVYSLPLLKHQVNTSFFEYKVATAVQTSPIVAKWLARISAQTHYLGCTARRPSP